MDGKDFRILVVESANHVAQRWRDDDDPWLITSAKSAAEAVALMEQQRFHMVVVLLALEEIVDQLISARQEWSQTFVVLGEHERTRKLAQLLDMNGFKRVRIERLLDGYRLCSDGEQMCLYPRVHDPEGMLKPNFRASPTITGG